eukprot:scaffold55282_cov60-Phaeocystis_antarctica.AAC.4
MRRSQLGVPARMTMLKVLRGVGNERLGYTPLYNAVLAVAGAESVTRGPTRRLELRCSFCVPRAYYGAPG